MSIFNFFKPKKKKKKNIFERRNAVLDEIYDYQHGKSGKDDFQNMKGKKKRSKK